MIYRISAGIFFLAVAATDLHLVAVPLIAMGFLALVMGIALLAGV